MCKRLAIFLLVLARASAAPGEDWPRWRGPSGDGINREAGLLQRWPDTFEPAWRADVGLGFASPVARAGRLYLFSTIDGRDTLTCYDAETGQVIWSERDESGWSGLYPGTRATPHIDRDRIYTYGSVGDLTARDLVSGNSLWHVNAVRETGALPIRYAQTSNPLVVGNFIYVQSGWGKPLPRGATTRSTTTPSTAPTRHAIPVAIAVDKRSGNVVWQSQFMGMSSYAGVVEIDVQGARQLVVFAHEGPVGMDPLTGKTLWQQPWLANSYGNCADPIYRDGHLFISSFNKQGCAMLRLSGDRIARLWDSLETSCRFQPPILEGDAMYLNSEGTLKCLRWPSGELLWATSKEDKNLLNFGGSIVRIAGERMILLSQNGRLSLAHATPQRFELLASVPDVVEGRQVWATPMIHNGRLYLKGERELVCIDLRQR